MAADSSWGGGGRVGALRSMDGAEREQRRAEARDRRAGDRIAAAEARANDRAAARDAAARQREEARGVHRGDETPRRSTRVTGDADGDRGLTITKRRASGTRSRTGQEDRTERDTRHYQTIVDIGRMCELRRRGASVAGLAKAFGISEAEVEATLGAVE